MLFGASREVSTIFSTNRGFLEHDGRLEACQGVSASRAAGSTDLLWSAVVGVPGPLAAGSSASGPSGIGAVRVPGCRGMAKVDGGVAVYFCEGIEIMFW